MRCKDRSPHLSARLHSRRVLSQLLCSHMLNNAAEKDSSGKVWCLFILANKCPHFFFFASEDCSIFLSFGFVFGFVLLLFSEELSRVSSPVFTEHTGNMNLATCSCLQTR